ncbi:type IV secretory system conjugative DNA transfer family protein (plasmid) [Hymenobacter sp. BRD128]|uniref:TraM recognition domain-containing protein n=1 Tax=Hymenobacter sp. BRD128 TaxID=2675878 RepID=UPI001563DA7B|nr:TraM recognition domain-containing protein [Hymenobacter sp. BRD128]QKG59105.1 type IV secretory system conjugative DNA transfer family protein [Hymenobacter sp. BRD128]
MAIVLVFAQGPPKEKVGVKRRKANPAQIKKLVYGLSVLMVPASLVLLFVHHLRVEQLATYYPASGGALLFMGFLAGMMRGALKTAAFGLHTERKLHETPWSFNLRTDDGGFINVPNPDRGTLVLGGAGAGKSFSIGEPLVEQFAMKGRCGLIYDFKFPVLAAAAQKALILAEPTVKQLHAQAVAKARALGAPEPQPLRHHIINFTDMTRTEKVNPFRPQDMPDISYAMEYAQTIISNLGTSAKGGDDFFEKSAYAYLTSIIWFYRNNYPQFCTIPHVVATALYEDLSAVLSMLKADPQAAGMAQSLIVAVEQKAEKQVAAVVASLQIALVRINTPNIAWVLTPDEERGEGFSLNLNDPLAPKLLTIGNNPTLKTTFSPVIACVVATALKLMNQQGKHPSYVFLDEAATIYVPGLEVIPATARSNKVAMIYMTQDMAQMTDAYGPEKMKVLISNLNNQFFGKVNSLETAKFVSDMIGREDREMVSVSSGKNQGGKGGKA